MADADVWLTVAAEDEFNKLQGAAADWADAVAEAINDITVKAGQPIDLPGAPPEAPFLAKEPPDPDAPAVIYRHAVIGEQGKWLVVSLMNRDDYRATRRAERELAAYPLPVQDLVRRVMSTVADTAATNVNAEPGAVSVDVPQPHGASTARNP